MVNETKKSVSDERKLIKKKAKSILSDHNIRMKLIFSSLVCIATFMLTEIVKSSFFYALSYSMPVIQAEQFALFLDITFAIPRLLILSPLFIGYFSFATKLCAGSDPYFYELFVYYSSPQTIFRTWAVGAVVMLPQILITALISLIPYVFGSLLESTSRPELKALFILMPIILEVGLFFLSILSIRLYTVINAYVCGKDQSLLACISVALSSTRRSCFKIFAFIASFVPWIVLSLCTVGVLFVIFTIPYMTVAYNIYSSELVTETLSHYQKSEEI